MLSGYLGLLSAPPTDQLTTVLIIITSSTVVSIILELYIPYKMDWNRNRGDLIVDIIQSNIILPIGSKVAEFLLFTGGVFLLGKNHLVDLTGLNIWVQLLIALLVSEFFYYWIHRYLHMPGIGWKLHVVHHSSTRVYWANSAKFNILEVIPSTFFYLIPFIIFDTTPQVIGLFFIFTAVTGLNEHVNIAFKGRYLNYFFNTAHLHRWHHSIIVKESNRNFGKALSVWDLVFGTWFLPNRDVGEVGVEKHSVKNSVWNQTIYPFLKN